MLLELKKWVKRPDLWKHLVLSSLCRLKKNVGNFQQDVNYLEEFYKLGKNEWKLWLQKPNRLGKDEWKCSSKDWHVFKSNFLVCWSGRMNVCQGLESSGRWIRKFLVWPWLRQIVGELFPCVGLTLLFASQFLEKMNIESWKKTVELVVVSFTGNLSYIFNNLDIKYK